MHAYHYDPSGNLRVAIPSPAMNEVSPKIVGQPVDQVVESGDDASFSVVIDSMLNPTFQWRFNSADIPGETADSLALTNVGRAQEGKYSVEISGPAGSIVSRDATLALGTSSLPNPAPTLQLVAYSDAGGTIDDTAQSGGPVRKLRYNVGDTVEVFATPFPPSVFAGWNGLLPGDTLAAGGRLLRINMQETREVRARFVVPTARPPTLVAFWRAEGDAKDASSFNHDGAFYTGGGSTPTPPSIQNPGKVGMAFNFDGKTHVRIPDSPDLRPAQITIEAWVFLKIKTNSWQTVMARGSSSDDEDTWALGIRDGVPHFFTFPHHDLSPAAARFSALPTDQWVHLAGTYNGETKRLYVNGVIVASEVFKSVLFYDPKPVPVTIGSDWGGMLGFPLGTSYWGLTGFVDEVSICSSALRPSQIMDIFNADLAGREP